MFTERWPLWYKQIEKAKKILFFIGKQVDWNMDGGPGKKWVWCFGLLELMLVT